MLVQTSNRMGRISYQRHEAASLLCILSLPVKSEYALDDLPHHQEGIDLPDGVLPLRLKHTRDSVGHGQIEDENGLSHL